ncbi:secondary thiamine-phosphate synthase enzyme [Streptohalobacillus salinus]|uniref:Secondary thiamine-phosphate synthase enzyme n=1 Tax=Streptohalobacillus salinus TaxID=621096 RepID=A0A2V3WFX1_9BACI|nr:secondary thiamine-phosphate synthase enzyme YjbQ [Streptohalobacillus salinus]PXW92153.1 secondary thiamine-phosphate synthase enzyme [Streptohalobacillus salinus]
MFTQLNIATTKHAEMIEVTHQVQNCIEKLGVKNGTVLVSSLHTTAGLTVNENADPDVKIDFLNRLEHVFPWEDPQDRHIEGNTAAHLKTSLVGHAQTLVIKDGNLLLGRWQGLYFCEFDGPRDRTIHLKFMLDED